MPLPDPPWEGSQKEAKFAKRGLRIYVFISVLILIVLVWPVLYSTHPMWGPLTAIFTLMSLALLIFDPTKPGERLSILVRLFIFFPAGLSALAIFSNFYVAEEPILVLMVDIVGVYLMFWLLFKKHKENK